MKRKFKRLVLNFKIAAGMLHKPTFQQQYDKIVDAYMKGTLNPFHAHACFIGNLFDGKSDWANVRFFLNHNGDDEISMSEYSYWMNKNNRGIACYSNAGYISDAQFFIDEKSAGLYTAQDIVNMENNFLRMYVIGDKTEESLFIAMETTLEMLRDIHEKNGEKINYNSSFKQRPTPELPFIKTEIITD